MKNHSWGTLLQQYLREPVAVPPLQCAWLNAAVGVGPQIKLLSSEERLANYFKTFYY